MPQASSLRHPADDFPPACLPATLLASLDHADTGRCGILPVVQAMGKAFGTLHDKKDGKSCDR
jgi:hypothetical protein